MNEAADRASHAIFIVSPEGRIAYMVVSPMNVDYRIDETTRILTMIQEERDSPVELSPVGSQLISKADARSEPLDFSPPLDQLMQRKQKIERRIRAREFVFGLQDGVLSTVGLLSGVAAATHSQLALLITGVTAAITGGLSMANGDVVLFAHAHILRILTACWLGLPPDAARLFVLRTASISVLGFEHDTRVMTRWNLSDEEVTRKHTI